MATIFYAWQADTDGEVNRYLIRDALTDAIERIRSDMSIAIDPRLDHDTQGTPGAPDIMTTILAKIGGAAVFIGDVSIVNSGAGRPAPNPNVLFEAGYALSRLGDARLVFVANTAFGTIEDLPFDIRGRRIVTYELPAGSQKDARESQRKILAGRLVGHIRPILALLRQPQPHTLPKFDLAWARLDVSKERHPKRQDADELHWALSLHLYVTPPDSRSIYLPFHLSEAFIDIPGYLVKTPLSPVRLRAAPNSKTIEDSASELIITGAGTLHLSGDMWRPLQDAPTSDGRASVDLRPADSSFVARIDFDLIRDHDTTRPKTSGRWNPANTVITVGEREAEN